MWNDGNNGARNLGLQSMIEPLKVGIASTDRVPLFRRHQIRCEARHRVGMLNPRVCYSNYNHGKVGFFALGVALGCLEKNLDGLIFQRKSCVNAPSKHKTTCTRKIFRLVILACLLMSMTGKTKRTRDSHGNPIFGSHSICSFSFFPPTITTLDDPVSFIAIYSFDTDHSDTVRKRKENGRGYDPRRF